MEKKIHEMIDFFNFFKLLVFKQLRGGLNCFFNSRSPFVIFVKKIQRTF